MRFPLINLPIAFIKTVSVTGKTRKLEGIPTIQYGIQNSMTNKLF